MIDQETLALDRERAASAEWQAKVRIQRDRHAMLISPTTSPKGTR